jgi:hypothetical protein
MALLDPLHQYNLRAFAPLEPPALTTPTIDGNPGTAVYGYLATFKTLVGETTAGVAVSISNGPDALSGFNRIKLEVKDVPAVVKKIRFFKQAGPVFCLLAEVDASIAACWDEGQALQANIHPPTENTSGRNNWIALLPRAKKVLQSPEIADLQGIFLEHIRRIVRTFHRDGDIVSGGKERSLGDNQWAFTELEVVLEGLHLTVPEGTVTLTGQGTEKVGLMFNAIVITDNDDPVLRNPSEGGDWQQYGKAGAYRLGYEVAWVVDQPGMVVLREFIDGLPKVEQNQWEATELDKKLAERTYEVSGSFIVENFQVKALPHETDPTQFVLMVYPGKAYPEGFRVKTLAPQPLVQPKARETAFVDNAVTDVFNCPGGSILGTVAGPFDVDGKAVKIQVGDGNAHTVGLTGNGQTATQVANQIMNALNAYPTAPGILVYCVADSDGHVQIQAINGKTLKLLAVANDAYGILGVLAGTYQPGGQRVYPIAESFVKEVSDLNYPVVVVEAVTHNGLTHIDPLGNTNVRQILGASANAADAHDGKWTWRLGVDFGKTGDSIDFTLYGGADPSAGATYYVAYEHNYTAHKGSRVLVKVTDAQVVKGALGGQDALTVTGGTYTKVIDGSSVAGLSGTVVDAVEILQVNNSPGQGQSEYSEHALLKNAAALGYSASKIDWSSAGNIQEEQPATGATYYATFTFWQHATEGDYVSADSYDHYEKIEKAPNNIWTLRDCIDFRTSGKMPRPGENSVFDLRYYLSRIDLVILKPDGNFYALTGAAAKKPVEPARPARALVIAKALVGAYTYSAAQVTVVPVQALRRTQMGIQELAEEIQKLQYYQALKNLAVTAKESAASAAIEAKGIFTDPLTGTGRCDFSFARNGVAFTAAIDAKRQVCKLPVSQDARELAVDFENSTGIARVGKTICFDYEAVPWQSQLRSTECMNVNPYEFFSWAGILRLDPEQDVFTDINQLPTIDVNYDDNMAALAQIEAENAERAQKLTWGSWHFASDSADSFLHESIERSLQQNDPVHWRDIDTPINAAAVSEIRQREGTYESIVPMRTLVDLGEKVLDRTVVPMMRTKFQDGSTFYVECDATSMYPGVAYACTINGMLVDLEATGSYAQGELYQGRKTVITDASGRLTGKFAMPEGILTGTALVKVFYTVTPEVAQAAAEFYSQGYRETRQSSVMGIVSTTTRTEVAAVQRQRFYQDPLAQTFLVTEDDGTVYSAYVDLYVCAKDAHIPLTVEIRDTVNGYPGQFVYQTKTLMPSEINADERGLTRTRFWFDNVVGYGPAEYAIAILANSKEYWIRVCQVGKVAVEDNQIVMGQQHGGVLFGSPNGSTWVAKPDYDLKFEIGRSNFQNNCQIVFSDITGIEAGMLVTKVTQFLPEGVRLRWSYSIDGGQSWIPFQPLVDTSLGSIATAIKLLVDVTAAGGTFLIVDSVAGVLFLLHDPEGDYVSTNATLADPSDKVCIYLNVNADGVNGQGARTVTPYYSRDDGATWCELKPPANYVPVAVGDGTFQEWRFETANEKSVGDAANTTPIVITSVSHEHTENEIVVIDGVGGNTNANGIFRIKNVTVDTFELHDPVSDAAIVGNGAYTAGGTIRLDPISQCRYRINKKTNNRAITPEWSELRGIAGNLAA